MTVVEYLVKELVKKRVTDVFGIPGGVILPLIYELDRANGIEPHLTYHEQTAAFAACGYAQASGTLGVAYATRGPGICNMFTAIAEAYQESIPVLFITSHGKRQEIEGVRFTTNQEMNIVASVRNITKYAANIDNDEDVIPIITSAIRIATSGRRGPVLIDMYYELWKKDVEPNICDSEKVIEFDKPTDVLERIENANRPIILIGDGLRYGVDKTRLLQIAERVKLPVLSSRGAQDLMSGSPYYYGYIGSHGIRYSNFILSKADLIISLGNRMSFSFHSLSYESFVEKDIIRIDIDEGEHIKGIPGETFYKADAGIFIESLKINDNHHEWVTVCEKIKQELIDEDCTDPVKRIVEFIESQKHVTYVCDIGNNEFWFSRAYERSNSTDQVLVSKSFATLGSAIGKSIGAYYSNRNEVICVTGDQGFQYNIQELQYIAQHNLPIRILLINNGCSRMIADHEKNIYDKYIHVNGTSGYSTPRFADLAKVYGTDLTEIKVDEQLSLTPRLPRGNAYQDMEPSLDRKRYDMINNL